MASSRKPTAEFWITVAFLAVLVGYPISFGPACWVSSRHGRSSSAEIVSHIYAPAIRVCSRCPNFVLDFAWWYSEVGAANNYRWYFGHWRQLDGTESCIGPHE